MPGGLQVDVVNTVWNPKIHSFETCGDWLNVSTQSPLTSRTRERGNEPMGVDLSLSLRSWKLCFNHFGFTTDPTTEYFSLVCKHLLLVRPIGYKLVKNTCNAFLPDILLIYFSKIDREECKGFIGHHSLFVQIVAESLVVCRCGQRKLLPRNKTETHFFTVRTWLLTG